MSTTQIATAFLDLALKHKWSEVGQLPDNEVQTLFEIITAAGFESTRFVFGKLMVYHRDEDGRPTSESYPINKVCPYKVIGMDGEYHLNATVWLDHTLSLALDEKGKDRQKSIEIIQLEIERSIPLKPIQLTIDGDFMRELQPCGFFADHTRDNHKLPHGSSMGIHAHCNGFMDRIHQTTETHSLILCRRCHLRVLFPKDIITYGQLRLYLDSKK